MHKNLAATLAAGLLAASAQAVLAEDGFSVGAGVSYTEGDYGTSATTKILAIPFTARYDRGPWTLKATLPWLRITGGSGVIPGLGTVPNSNPRGRGRSTTTAGATTTTTTTPEATASGWGDLVTAVTYNAYYDGASKLGVDLTGRVKWGTADRDKGLGTGENDYGAQVDAYKGFDRVTAFGGIGYTHLGSSDFVQLNNVWNLNLGASYKINDSDAAGLSYDWREKASSTSAELSEVTAFWSRRFDRSWKMQLYGLKGLANGSPNWGAGISAAYAF